MRRHHRQGWVGATLLAAALICLGAERSSRAQFIGANSIDLSGPIQLDECDNATRGHLERVRAYLDDAQWDEAIETLRQVMETGGDRVIRLEAGRYISVRDYCQLQIAELFPQRREALTLYRQRVDPLAKQWYEAGIASRNEELLDRVVHQAYSSSWGDDALFALGELALERADYGGARAYWQQLDPTWRAENERPLWLGLRESTSSAAPAGRAPQRTTNSDSPHPGLRYPDTDLELADVRARLVLCSILEGSPERANLEMRYFARLHSDAKGHLAGRDGRYADILLALASEAPKWVDPATSTDWPTFAGSFSRNRVVAKPIVVGGIEWRSATLGDAWRADVSVANSIGLPQNRVGESNEALLSYHPIVIGDVLLYNNQRQVFALNLRTGKPHWPGLEKGGEDTGAIYTEPDFQPANNNRQMFVGVPRFTLSCYGNLVYARMGSPITTRQSDSTGGDKGALVCLDLKTQGGLVNRLSPDEKWAFEGSPVCDGDNVYVAMRYSDVRPQSHVACYDAQLGRLRWRRMVCSAETLGHGQNDEASQNLLTLQGDTLYLNTNMGAVAALSASDGKIKWIHLYGRAKGGDLSSSSAHFFRDLNPCVYYKGMVLVAPSDCDGIFALDAASGHLLWSSDLARDAVHLLGVAGDYLLASGDRLWWIDVNTGKQKSEFGWPEQRSSGTKGIGRGVLAGDSVYFPNQSVINVLSWSVPDQLQRTIRTAEMFDVKAGNLVPAGEYLVVASDSKLYVLRPTAAPRTPTNVEAPNR